MECKICTNRMYIIGIIVTAFITQEVISESSHSRSLALANSKFAWKLYKAFPSRGNLFYSPISIFSALGMLYKGARGTTAKEMHHTLVHDLPQLNGHTIHEEFREFLNDIGKTKDEYKLEIANAIICDVRYPMLDNYRDEINYLYGALGRTMDFRRQGQKALVDINNWVKEKTHGRILKIVEDLDPLTASVLLNAIYFKGTWKTQFDPKKTRREPFYNDGVSAIDVPMMNTEATFLYRRYTSQGFHAVKFLYKGKRFSMVIILPLRRNDLKAVESILTAEAMSRITSDMVSTRMEVAIPKFKLQDSKELVDIMKDLGMTNAFGKEADFSGIDGQIGMSISNVLHKAIVEVTEEGSEAAAATAVVRRARIFTDEDPIPVFRADHPFLFVIQEERTGMALFVGRVTQL